LPLRSCSTTLLVLAALLITATPARAVVVFRKGQDKPLMGFLVRQDEMRVIVQRLLPGGGMREEVLLRSEIASLIETVDRARLAGLKHDEPKAYRDYAEELAEKRQDPEARYTAIRLYLISVWLDRSLARSSLLGMVALARSEREEARFRALAFLLDADHDSGLLRRPQVTVEAPPELDSGARDRVLQLVRLLRQDRTDEARSMLADPATNKALGQFEEFISLSEIQTVANRGLLTPTLLEKLVRLELSLGAPVAVSEEAARPAAVVSWQEGTRREGFAPLPVLTLETVTEFNPRACQYRDGAWIDPDRE
jgi:hypothetical protein